MQSHYMRLLMLVAVLFCSNQALSQASQNHEAIEERAKTLDLYAREAMDSENASKVVSALKSYFQVFPSDFKTFQQIFGYRRDGRGRFVAKPPVNHTLFSGFLPKLKSAISTKEYYEKMLSVGVGGVWDADEVNHLRRHLTEIVVENVRLSIEVLSKKEEKEIRSFWRFLFDGPHPGHRLKRKYYDELYPEVRDLNPKIAEQLKLAYEQLLSEYDGHGQ